MSNSDPLREQLVSLLQSQGAHLDFDRAIEGLPPQLRGKKPSGVPYSPWDLVEHMRICQWDILEYIRDPEHESPSFPDGYWPANRDAPSEQAWTASVRAFRSDLQSMQDLVSDPEIDVLAQISHGEPGHTVLREALLLADHNAYHLGQLIVVRRALGAWSAS